MRRIILLYCAKLLYRVVFYHAATIFNRFRQFYSFEERRNLRRMDERTEEFTYGRKKMFLRPNKPATACTEMRGRWEKHSVFEQRSRAGALMRAVTDATFLFLLIFLDIYLVFVSFIRGQFVYETVWPLVRVTASSLKFVSQSMQSRESCRECEWSVVIGELAGLLRASRSV